MKFGLCLLKSFEFGNFLFGRTETASFAIQKDASIRVFLRDLTTAQMAEWYRASVS